MDIQKSDFLTASVGLGVGLAASESVAQAQPAPPPAAAQQPRYVWSGKQPATVDPSYKPRRLNKPGDMAMSLNGLSFFPDPPLPRATEYSVPASIAPNVQQARLRVAAACRASGFGLLDTAIPETVVDSIKLGAKVIECAERSALIGREYTKRKMPV
jgi:hypothetical protein